jgi:hypothetical protein
MMCFTVAFACHGLAVFVILANATAATDFDFDGPVVLFDRAQPLPRPPETVTDRDLSFIAPVHFTIS